MPGWRPPDPTHSTTYFTGAPEKPMAILLASPERCECVTQPLAGILFSKQRCIQVHPSPTRIAEMLLLLGGSDGWM